ncbi:MAG: SpoIID/LytB domain-containing protein [Acetatifactor sp.]|nr:SpoIID/LytB domain-containing protein [Acetatifactor sp.]
MNNKWGLNKSQRMQLKAFICLLGLILIVVLFLGKLASLLLHRQQAEEQPDPSTQTSEPHVPVVQVFTNVWILEDGEEGLLIFHDGQREQYPYGEKPDASDLGDDISEDMSGNQFVRPEGSVREQVADVELTDGAVTSVNLKTEKLNGRILGADDTGVEVEGYGKLPLAEDYRGYRLYGSLQMCTVRDLHFGYSNADLCLEDGEICGILMAREETMEKIRVLIKTADYGGKYHEQLVLTSDTSFTVTYGSYESPLTEGHSAGEEWVIDTTSSYFEGGRIRIAPDVLTGKVKLKNVSRSQGQPAYRGQMELLLTDQGIVVINEVPLEEYLYSVVPSEMPSSYPAEALKAQAVCARTYAYGHMEHAGYPQYGAHVDDSSSYQVYNNILEQESTTTAVKDSYGQLLYTSDGELASTYYYSTSCGVGSDATVWKTANPPDLPYLKAKHLSHSAMTEQVAAMAGGLKLPEDDIGVRMQDEETFAEFITTVNKDDFEAEEGWYRWTYSVGKLDSDYITKRLQDRYDVNSRLVLTLVDGEYVSRKIGDIGVIKDIYVAQRGPGGVAEELVIEAKNGTYKVISEHNIRYVLNNGTSKVERQDGSKVASTTLLPSGFFVISTSIKDGNVVGYTLSGGGFGHGVGMSQNGARQMARSGFLSKEILLFFYENCVIRDIYD